MTSSASAWRRELPGLDVRRGDIGVALLLALSSFITALLYQRTGIYEETAEPWVWALGIGFSSLPLALRRAYPVPVAVLVSIGFFICGQFGVPDLLIVQICLFLALYTIGAWEPNRSLALWSRIALTAFMFAWVIIALIISSSDESFMPGAPRSGIFSSFATFAVIQIITNLIYFGGAFAFGERAWRSARAQSQLEAQAVELALERQTSATQAVSLDRLEIARELHDVVAHHISVMGLQAAAARRSLERAPETAAQALEVVEESAQSTITELRSLVHTLRSPDAEGELSASTVGVSQLPALVATSQSAGTPTTLIVAGSPTPLPLLVDIALYRVVQEALTNVRKHAGRGATATVRLRYESDAVEVEISDDGVTQRLPHRANVRSASDSPMPLGAGNLDGSGLGLRGMHERISAVGGTVEAGRREHQGFLVRARVPHRTPEGAA